MLWNHRYLARLDFRLLMIMIALMIMSVLVISSTTQNLSDLESSKFMTPFVKSQLKWFMISSVSFVFFAGFDYRKLRNSVWILYLLMILMLIGLFFSDPIQNVRRWYRVPGVNMMLQPSEYAKLILVFTLSLFLEKHQKNMHRVSYSLIAGLLVCIPFLLILKQPDLGTALILYPMALVMFYYGGMHRLLFQGMSIFGLLALTFIMLMYLGVFSHEQFRPIATKVLKEYQYERFNPDIYHQKASQAAIALGGFTGSGWQKSDIAANQFLPAAHTDSVFAGWVEEFGLIGGLLLIVLFAAMIYCTFQVSAIARDSFGRLLSAGIATYLSIHIIMNIGMMCGFLPITGIPLVLVTYGGSSILSTMSALGILQSIYTRRFMFS